MAKINYSDYASRQSSSTASKKELKVGYFNVLKDDGDEAVVRFNYNTPADFDMATVHKVKVGDYYRHISCLRTNGKEPVEKCPLCGHSNAEFAKVQSRMFAKLITYSKDEAGKLVVSAHVWNRPALFSKDIVNAYNEGVENGFYVAGTPISEVVFKIRRDGIKGSKDTKYRIIATNPAVFKREVYVADFSSFENFDVSHHSYMIRTKDEISTFITTGELPKPTPKEDTTTVASAPAVTPVAVSPVSAAPATTPVVDPVTPVTSVDTERPHRYSSF